MQDTFSTYLTSENNDTINTPANFDDLDYTKVSLRSKKSIGVKDGWWASREEKVGQQVCMYVHLGRTWPESIMGKVAVVVHTTPRSPARQPPLTRFKHVF